MTKPQLYKMAMESKEVAGSVKIGTRYIEFGTCPAVEKSEWTYLEDTSTGMVIEITRHENEDFKNYCGRIAKVYNNIYHTKRNEL